jgi:hypothetical protein
MQKIWKFIQAVLGLGLLALAITVLIAADGPDPWGLLILAFYRHLPLSLGVTTQIGGLILILLNLFWGRRRPGLATFMSMILVGLFIDIIQSLAGGTIAGMPELPLLAAGIIIMALGISIYVKAGLGEGPVEGMMFVLSDKLGISIGSAKVIQDLSFVFLGCLLGQFPKWGTLVTALGVGPLTQGLMRISDLTREMKKAPEAPK